MIRPKNIINVYVPNRERKKREQMTYYEQRKLCRDGITLFIVLLSFILTSYFTFNRYDESVKLSLRQTAISEAYKLKSRDFYQTNTKLLTIANEIADTDSLFNCGALYSVYLENNCNKAGNLAIQDFNYLFNSFQYISVIHSNNIADKQVLETTICKDAILFNDSIYQKFFPILNSIDSNTMKEFPGKHFKQFIGLCKKRKD